MRMTSKTWALVVFWASTFCTALQATENINIGAAVDMVANKGFGDDAPSDDRLFIRSAEISLFGPADHLFDGRLTLAAHPEDGAAKLEVHEAFIGSSRLIPHIRFKVGQFFLGVGRLNQLHQHEWAFIETPTVHKMFFGSEGVIDAGGEVSFAIPTSFPLELTLGLTNGWTFGHSHTEGKNPDIPTHYARVSSLQSLGDPGDIQVGTSYLGRKSKEKKRTHLLGLDVTFKDKRGTRLRWLVETENWFRHERTGGAEAEMTYGKYLYAQYGITDEWAVGVGTNLFVYLNKESASGRHLRDQTFGAFPVVSYIPSHYVQLRTAYQIEAQRLSGEKDRLHHMISAQAIFTLGAHSEHKF